VLLGTVAFYVCAIVVVTLYPFRFQEPRRLRDLRQEGAEWSRVDGMIFDATGMFSFAKPSPEIRGAIVERKGFYVAFEALPDEAPSPGPRRLFAYEAPSRTAFSLNQQGDGLLLRLTGRNPTVSDYLLENALPSGVWTHLCVSVAPDSIRFWRNGTREAAYPTQGFEPKGWTRSAYWLAGNDSQGELGWRGRIRSVVLGAGVPPVTAPADLAQLLPSSPALFALSARENVYPRGWFAHKTSALGLVAREPWSLVPFSEPFDRAWARVDWVLNLLLLFPLGCLLALRGHRSSTITWIGFALSLFIEIAQIFIPVRHSQSTDLVLNTTGALLGALAARWFVRWVASVIRSDALAP
jgi:VanZ family protein